MDLIGKFKNNIVSGCYNACKHLNEQTTHLSATSCSMQLGECLLPTK